MYRPPVGTDRWHAGAVMMAAASPKAWNELVAADELVRANEAALETCRKAAAKTGKEQRCVVTVPAL